MKPILENSECVSTSNRNLHYKTKNTHTRQRKFMLKDSMHVFKFNALYLSSIVFVAMNHNKILVSNGYMVVSHRGLISTDKNGI